MAGSKVGKGDGDVTRAQHEKQARYDHMNADTDHDGNVTLREMQEWQRGQ